MEFKKFAEKHFYAEIKENREITSELRHKLLNQKHPRLETFMNNLAKQLLEAQQGRVRAGKPPFKLQDLVWSVRETTKVFLLTIEIEAKKMYETEAQRLAAQKAASELADMDATLEGKPQGAFEEMGLVITDGSTTHNAQA